MAHRSRSLAAVEPDTPAVEERLELLRWAGTPERLTYLAVLRTFDEAKAGYEVQLRPLDVATAVERVRGEPVDGLVFIDVQHVAVP